MGEVLAAYGEGGAAAFEWAVALRDRLRARLASLLGVSARDLALTGGATHGIQAVALSFPWRAGDRVLLLDGEFPANVTPWQRAAELFGLDVAFAPVAAFERSDEEGLAAVEAELRRGARLVAVSAVQFRSGLAMPLRALSRLCARHGAQLFVDAIQALGVVPLDAALLEVDYLASGAHKWLMGAEGAGFLYVRPERATALRPALAGWLSHVDPVAFLSEGPGHLRYDRPIRREAGAFEAGSTSVLSQAALDAALAILLELGIPAIEAHVNAYLDRLEPLLLERGFTGLRAREPGRRSGILSAVPPPGHEARAIRDGLAAAGVAVAIPDGVVRFSPHWHSAWEVEGPSLGGALDAALAGKRL